MVATPEPAAVVMAMAAAVAAVAAAKERAVEEGRLGAGVDRWDAVVMVEVVG